MDQSKDTEVQIEGHERFSTPEEIKEFWTEERIASANKAKETVNMFAALHHNLGVPDWNYDQTVLIINPNQIGSLMYYDGSSDKVLISLRSPDPTISPTEMIRSTAHELTHKIETQDFRDLRAKLSTDYNLPSDTQPIEIIDEAVVSEATYPQLNDQESSLNHTKVYGKSWRAFATICEKVADKLPEFGGREQDVIKKFQEWTFEPGKASEMLPTLERAFGVEGLKRLIELTSGYVNGTTDRNLQIPENDAKYQELITFFENQ